jgi:excisionase family DNA binding protein
MPGDPQTVSVAEAAEVLGVHPQTLYREIANGSAPFPVIRLGDRILIPKAAIERLVGAA